MFCPQACCAGGPGPFRSLLYKDVNRHVPLVRRPLQLRVARTGAAPDTMRRPPVPDTSSEEALVTMLPTPVLAADHRW